MSYCNLSVTVTVRAGVVDILQVVDLVCVSSLSRRPPQTAALLLIGSTGVFLRSGFQNCRVLFTKRTKILAYLSPIIKDSWVLTVIGDRAVRQSMS